MPGKSLIVDIARATRACAANGTGTAIAVFADGSHTETTCPDFRAGRDNGENGIEWALMYFFRPTSRAEVADVMAGYAALMPEELLKSEWARRSSAKRRTFGAGTGRPAGPRCPCGAMSIQRAADRNHKCENKYSHSLDIKQHAVLL